MYNCDFAHGHTRSTAGLDCGSNARFSLSQLIPDEYGARSVAKVEVNLDVFWATTASCFSLQTALGHIPRLDVTEHLDLVHGVNDVGLNMHDLRSV